MTRKAGDFSQPENTLEWKQYYWLRTPGQVLIGSMRVWGMGQGRPIRPSIVSLDTQVPAAHGRSSVDHLANGEGKAAMPGSRLIAFVVKEAKEALPAIIFFAIGFNLVVLTTQLVLDAYSGQFASFTVATLAALLVGKAVLVANALPFFRRFDTAPLIQPILYKTVIYWSVVAVLRFLENVIKYWAGGGKFSGIPEYVAVHFPWHRFFAVQIWIFTLFLIYATASELNALFGEGEIRKIFLTRRQRIRTLVKLTRLTEAHTLDELRDPHAPAHAEMLGLIRGLSTHKGNWRH
jgi:hypothetical protein